MEIRMLAFALPYTLHVLAALVWVGGMFFAWLVLRPATVAALEGPARLRLWVEVFQRFFRWVWLAVAVLAVSGVGMIHLRFAGFETAPRYVQVMIGGGLSCLRCSCGFRGCCCPSCGRRCRPRIGLPVLGCWGGSGGWWGLIC